MKNGWRRAAGLRTGRPHLTADHGWPVGQSWRDGDGTEEQRLEARPFAGFFVGNPEKHAQTG
ncbi:hypothetical protein DPPLL_37790 [Desulfofustis limnaeus]|uniref:Uncharacterized protein n=1 Tax=Desulfofustis limnaeus TaxID=2740163 RepID=A0ABN6MDG9_9BACT|nr:hypothetical protein DPPLL_37790 [Desulfofustis limnaeus]